MERVVRTKFDQNPLLAKKLLTTYPRELIEKNHWHDNFWGACTCNRCSVGKNHLGRILMQVRSNLRDEELKKWKDNLELAQSTKALKDFIGPEATKLLERK